MELLVFIRHYRGPWRDVPVQVRISQFAAQAQCIHPLGRHGIRDGLRADTAGGRALITVDVAMGDVRAYPPGSHAGIVVLHLADQSAVTVTKAISDLAALAEPGSLAGVVAVLPTRPAANPPSPTGA